jgi:putative copper export protein/mono/diheme cytochrome c family protein
MLPPFDLQGGAMLAVARDASVTALLSAFGTVVFRALVAPKAFGRMTPEVEAAVKRVLHWLAQASVVTAILGTVFWLLVQAATMADADSLRETFAAAPTVLRKTAFGHVVVLQLSALVLVAALLGWRDHPRRHPAAVLVATLAVALQSGHSHAFSMVEGPSLLLGVDIVHLIGAGAWLGGLVPLLIVVRMAPPQAGAMAARWFSPLGRWCLVALLLSAAWQGWVLVATIPGLIGTAYGWMVLVKLVLFGALFGFAWMNRYHFAPALLGDAPEVARRVLMRSIALQTCFAITIVVAAVVLSELPPAMHLQALWPFAQSLSLDALREDADFRREVLIAAGALAVALVILVVSLAVRRYRLPALGGLVLIAWFATPHFSLLLVTAYPTSFYHSPTGFSAASIANGATVFAQNCAACHGAQGRGDGTAAKSLPIPPADLTAAHLWMHSDGELFWWISHGMPAPDGAPAMPGFAPTLDEDSRWAVIDYIRAHNAGAAHHDNGIWPQTIQAPGFGVTCSGRALLLDDLHGRWVRLVFGTASLQAISPDAVTVLVTDAAAPLPAGACVARDETVPTAYAIATGFEPAKMHGVQVLIDPLGRLRAVHAGSDSHNWDDPAALRADIATLGREKLAMPVDQAMPANMRM